MDCWSTEDDCKSVQLSRLHDAVAEHGFGASSANRDGADAAGENPAAHSGNHPQATAGTRTLDPYARRHLYLYSPGCGSDCVCWLQAADEVRGADDKVDSRAFSVNYARRTFCDGEIYPHRIRV